MNTSITDKLLAWYDKNKRGLPWRSTTDPYAIWVSEIMLQQTRVDTAIDYYSRFLSAFPDVYALAAAPESEVLNIWKGLGYYSRARNMMRTAKIIAAEHKGEFPMELEEIMKLPGIGAYTGGAILSIARNIPVPAVDGNVLRVISRLFAYKDDIALPAVKKKVAKAVADMIPAERAGDFTQAMMELGAMVCTPHAPRCAACPLEENCAARRDGIAEALPVRLKKSGGHIALDYRVLAVRSKNGILMQFRDKETLLGKMWGLPMAEMEKDQRGALMELGLPHCELQKAREAGRIKHVFTHRTWRMVVTEYKAGSEFSVDAPLCWVKWGDIPKLPIPAAFKKVLKLMEKDCLI